MIITVAVLTSAFMISIVLVAKAFYDVGYEHGAGDMQAQLVKVKRE
jgi:hypothetical protein